MITGEEIKVVDTNSEFFGVPASTLMENAGKGLADFIKKEIKPEGGVLFICGTGNNGGDGLVASRYLSKNYNVTVFLAGEEKDIKTDSVILSKIKEHAGIEIKTPEDYQRFEKHIKTQQSKFRQNYQKQNTENTKESSFEDIIDSVLGYAGYHYDEEMRLMAFLKIKARAEEKIRKASLKDGRN